MIIKKCTFDELPDAMQMHVLYCEKITVAEYRLAIWSNKDPVRYLPPYIDFRHYDGDGHGIYPVRYPRIRF